MQLEFARGERSSSVVAGADGDAKASKRPQEQGERAFRIGRGGQGGGVAPAVRGARAAIPGRSAPAHCGFPQLRVTATG